MKPECNGEIIFSLVKEYLILNIGYLAESSKMEDVRRMVVWYELLLG
jgi:hypothetical protein